MKMANELELGELLLSERALARLAGVPRPAVAALRRLTLLEPDFRTEHGGVLFRRDRVEDARRLALARVPATP